MLTGEGAKYMFPVDSETMKPHVVYVTETKPPEQCSSQELINELARRALQKPTTEETQE